MNKRMMGLIVLGCVTLGVAMVVVRADSGRSLHRHVSEDEWGERGRGSADVAPVTNAVYTKECDSCHLAFPPGLLPQRSWRALMAGLANHFGENAELPADTRQALLDYVTRNAADHHSDYRLSRRVLDDLTAQEAPLRITALRSFRREHDAVPRYVFQNNPKLQGFSDCIVCHRRADQGDFNENGIDIPGYGWVEG